MAETKIGFYGHVRQYHGLRAEIDGAIHEVLESGAYVLGPQVEQFEKELAAYCGTGHAVGLNSGTDALWLTLIALGIGAGDEVVTVANTFFATAEAIWLAGATPVFVDIDPKTRNIDVKKIEAAITPRTRAIVPVHLYGLPADMPAIAPIARAHNLFIIEDCAQAVGARGNGFRIGELSDAVCLSFIIQKNLGCFGDGGAVVTNRQDLVTSLKRLRNHGSLKRSYHSIGYNSRLDELHAAVLRVKLRHVDEWSDLRRARAHQYDTMLAGLPMDLPSVPAGYEPVYHLYVIECDDRDALQAYLASLGITALTHYPIAIHQQKGFPWGHGARIVGSLERTERSSARVLSLPMYPELTREEAEETGRAIQSWVASHKAVAQTAD